MQRHPAAFAIPLLASLIAAFALPAQAVAATPQSEAVAAPRATAKAARQLLDSAVTYLQDNPAERAFAAFNNQKGGFYRDDLYVFVVGINDGIMHAHGGAVEGLVGADVRDLRDAAGQPIIRAMLDLAAKNGEGSVDYVWLNRANNRVENKTTLVRRVGNYLVGVGYYVPRSSRERAQTLLDAAVAEARKAPAQAFARFNDPKGSFVRDDLYVFVVGLKDAKYYAMGATPQLVGSDARTLHDAAGHPVIEDMIALATSKGSGDYDYVWRNPATNKVENKHSRIIRVDDYLIGVGYYTK